MSTYWFRPKRFGLGATPCTWQGWLFTLAIVVAAFACAELARRSVPANLFDFKQAATFWFAALAAVIIVVGGAYVSNLKTEGGLRWRGLR
jgi:hypothetical protein